MVELRTLLHEAAPVPSRALDMGAVRARAQRRGARRAVAWLAGLGLAIGLGLPGGAGLVNAGQGKGDHAAAGRLDNGADRAGGGAGTEVRVEDAAASVDAGAPVVVRPPGGAMATASLSGRDEPNPAAPAPEAAAAGSATDPTAGPESASASTGSPYYPLAPWCAVDNRGLAEGATRRCRFTATAAGAASIASDGKTNPPPAAVPPSGDVTITRNGTTTTQHIDYSPRAAGMTAIHCGNIIEPGDLVEVVLTNATAPADGSVTTLGAGKDWQCWKSH